MSKKKQNKTSQQKTSVVKKNKTLSLYSLSQIKWGESYVSLLLGIGVVIIGIIVFASFFKHNNTVTQQISSTSTVQQPVQVAKKDTENTIYTVQPNDDLWHIAQKYYQNGDKWVDIANANHLANPSTIFTGDKLVIPSTDTIKVSANVDQLKQAVPSTYKVQQGDTLWSIAQKYYQNGDKWVDIANANHLVNPSIIHVGNTINLP